MQYGLSVDPEDRVEDLPIGIQQRVEIIKVLFRQASIVVFDEPTAVLTPQEIEEFFRIVESLRADGKGIVFITHKLREALRIADRIVVLRRGKTVGEVLPGDTDERELAAMMVGRPVELTVHKAPAQPGEVVLGVDDLVVLDPDGRALIDHVSFGVHAGEVVGIAGVQGNGQTELVEALVGLVRPESGRVTLGRKDVTHDSPRQRHSDGLAHIPEDRQREGMVKNFSVFENLALTGYYTEPYSSGPLMHWNVVEQEAHQLVEQFDIRTPSINVATGTLSGGNQQKVIVAREISRPIKAAILSQPTRGVDVGSIEYIHERIIALRDAGVAVLVVSTELDEVMALADRVLVMFDHRIVADLERTRTNHNEVGLYMAGATPTEAEHAAAVAEPMVAASPLLGESAVAAEEAPQEDR